MGLSKIFTEHKLELNDIPVLSYNLFYQQVVAWLQKPGSFIKCYDGYRHAGEIRMFCVVASNTEPEVKVYSYILHVGQDTLLAPITAHYLPAMEFEMKVSETFEITFYKLPRRKELVRTSVSMSEMLRKDLKHIHQN